MTQLVAEQARSVKPPIRALRVATFNVWVGQHADDLHRNVVNLAEDTDADVIALQEAHRLKGAIPGYDRWAADQHPRPEADMCVLLVRHGIEIRRNRLLVIDGPPWVGPHHGLKHPPRIFPWVVVETEEGQLWDVMCDHRTWVGHQWRNLPSWTAEDLQLERWSDRREHLHPKRPRLIVGDQNGSEAQTGPKSVTSLARRTRSQLLLKGVDGALAANCTGRARRLPGKRGSDGHRAVVVDVATS